tara:strand:+ start:19183 stop:19962 length:780 start_codon:yes stop_codon:yes gene_type:complete
MAFGFVYPVGNLLLGSLFTPEFSLSQYERIFETPLYLKVLLRTFTVSLYVMVAAALLGYPIAVAMARVKRRLGLIIVACVLISLWTSVLVRSYSWIVLLQRNGVINSLLTDAGLIDQPLRLLYTEGAVIMAMTHVLLPYMILPIFSAVRTIPVELENAARNLGANGWQTFVDIMLPLSMPGVFAGCLLTFILALGFFITPALVGGPQSLMMATLIGQQVTQTLDWPFASALSAMLLIATLIVVAVFRKFLSFDRGAARV